MGRIYVEPDSTEERELKTVLDVWIAMYVMHWYSNHGFWADPHHGVICEGGPPPFSSRIAQCISMEDQIQDLGYWDEYQKILTRLCGSECIPFEAPALKRALAIYALRKVLEPLYPSKEKWSRKALTQVKHTLRTIPKCIKSAAFTLVRP